MKAHLLNIFVYYSQNYIKNDQIQYPELLKTSIKEVHQIQPQEDFEKNDIYRDRLDDSCHDFKIGRIQPLSMGKIARIRIY